MSGLKELPLDNEAFLQSIDRHFKKLYDLIDQLSQPMTLLEQGSKITALLGSIEHEISQFDAILSRLHQGGESYMTKKTVVKIDNLEYTLGGLLNALRSVFKVLQEGRVTSVDRSSVVNDLKTCLMAMEKAVSGYITAFKFGDMKSLREEFSLIGGSLSATASYSVGPKPLTYPSLESNSIVYPQLPAFPAFSSFSAVPPLVATVMKDSLRDTDSDAARKPRDPVEEAKEKLGLALTDLKVACVDYESKIWFKSRHKIGLEKLDVLKGLIDAPECDHQALASAAYELLDLEHDGKKSDLGTASTLSEPLKKYYDAYQAYQRFLQREETFCSVK